MTRLSPKSAIMMSASSSLVLNSKFSGFKSDEDENFHSNNLICVVLTPMYDATTVNILHGAHDGPHKFSRIAKVRVKRPDPVKMENVAYAS